MCNNRLKLVPSRKQDVEQPASQTMRICSVNNDAARARNLARHGIAFYATIPYYDIVLSPLGFDREVKSIRDAFSRRDIPAMFSAVTDDMVAALALAGTPGDVRPRPPPALP